MRKLFVSAGVIALTLMGPAHIFADTTASTTTSVQVQAMLDQIHNLQVQIQTLNTAQTQAQTSAGNVSDTLKLIRTLKQGMSGSDVLALQTILASDPIIYPQGTVSGFYGSLTAEAVKKFQKKHGLETVGFVGPKTLQKLNEEIGHLGLSEDKEDNSSSTLRVMGEDHGKKFCVPPGHLIAPGWLKKHGDDDKPLVATCGNLPPGIAKKMGDDDHRGTTTPDVIAPVLSAISTHAFATSTQVNWTTNELATGKVWLGTTNPLVISSTTPMMSSGMFTANHLFVLSPLATSTTYFYVVASTDMSGNTATSSQASFMTLAQ